VTGIRSKFAFRSADGNPTLLRELAAELVRLKVDIVVAYQTPAVTAARQATSEIPIVMSAGDPVGTGLISSLARPGGNITGTSATAAEAGAKTLELIRDVLPSTRLVAVLAHAPDPFSRSYVELIEQGGHALDIAIRTIKVRGVEEFDAAFAAMDKERAHAVIVQPSLPRKPALDLALKHRLPPIGGEPVVFRRGRPSILLRQPKRHIPSYGILHRSNSQGHQAGRSPCGAADPVRACS
jgi:putative tryptophan/tyrosine transport system substrate-binding protein